MTLLENETVFPKWVTGVSHSFDICCEELREPGIYCIQYDISLDNEIRKMINGLFTCSFGSFVHYMGKELFDPQHIGIIKKKMSQIAIFEGELHPKIEKYIKENYIPFGSSKLKIEIQKISESISQLILNDDGKYPSLENPSFRALLYSVIAANKALQQRDVICFMVDIGRLDTEFIKFITRMFQSIYGEYYQKKEIRCNLLF